MSSKFVARYIPEPDLIFGNKNEDKDPRIGLKHFGPFFHQDEQSPLESVRIGIIGNKECTKLANDVLDFIQQPVISSKPNRWLFADYPGMNRESKFNCILRKSENWNALLSDDLELHKLENIENPNERIGEAVNLYLEKIESITQRDDYPNVIVCTLPKPVELYCGIGEHTYGAKTAKPSPLEAKIAEHKANKQGFLTEWFVEPIVEPEVKEKGFDFRNSLKGKAMKYGIPIQIIKESTLKHVLNYEGLKKYTKEDPATFSWNFSTALYYKANGKPWRLAKLRQDTCYVGVSFFIDKLSPKRDMQISMAQVFTHNGEGLVLRGTEVEVDKKTKRPYLQKEQAQTLMEKALKKYHDSSGQNPKRVVVHKSSIFSENEQSGFNKAIYGLEIPEKDFVAIRPSHGWINFIRLGNYPVLRGTLIEINDSEFLLYSSGFSPRIRSYAGHRIPNALRIEHIGDSQSEEVAKEILGLTKLNWNTTAFSTSLPITIRFADEVGKILSELAEDKVLQDHYRFFM
ncbi:MAG: hypothetical protein WAO91_01680 [Candidatus Nitrosotenuis sp.]